MKEIKVLDDDILSLIPKRKSDAHKGTYKKVLIIAGSINFSGAAILSSLAAYKTGAGLVKILTTKKIQSVVASSVVEAIYSFYAEDEDFNSKKEYEEYLKNILDKELNFADLVLIGPGLSSNFSSKILLKECLKNFKKKLIIDAEAINILARDKSLLKYLDSHCILSPHLKEMSRLIDLELEYIKNNDLKCAEDFTKKYKCNLILKSSTTIISNKNELRLNNIKEASLSKAGSGDVLVGILLGILCICENLSDIDMLSLAVYLHNLAARISREKYNEHSVIARDIIDNIYLAMNYKNKGV